MWKVLEKFGVLAVILFGVIGSICLILACRRFCSNFGSISPRPAWLHCLAWLFMWQLSGVFSSREETSSSQLLARKPYKIPERVPRNVEYLFSFGLILQISRKNSLQLDNLSLSFMIELEIGLCV